MAKLCLLKHLQSVLDVPFAIADATTLTEAGYVGEDVENILLRLIQAADFDLEKQLVTGLFTSTKLIKLRVRVIILPLRVMYAARVYSRRS